MRVLKWLAIGLAGLFVLFLLLPGSPGPSSRRLGAGELETVGMLLGGMTSCGADAGWVADVRIRLRQQDNAAFVAHFEPAYTAGQRLGVSASTATCADMLRSGRSSIDRITGR